MNQRPSQLTRFRVMAAMALAVLAIYLVVLFNTQVVHHEEYLAKSIQTITRMENVEASRGIITDRSGRTLVTNQSTYSLTFDASLLKPGENQNDAILRLVTLCRIRESLGRITSPSPWTAQSRPTGRSPRGAPTAAGSTAARSAAASSVKRQVTPTTS